MNEDVRTVQAAIYRCQNEKAVAVDPERKRLLAQEESVLRQRLRDLKKANVKPGGKTRPWIVILDVQGGELAAQPFYPNAFNLPDTILLEMNDIIAAAIDTVTFIRELGIKATLETMRELSEKDLCASFGLPTLRVVSRDELLKMAKRGEVQVRFTSTEEDRRLNEHLAMLRRTDGQSENEGSTSRLRPGLVELHRRSTQGDREHHGGEGPRV